MEGIAVVVAVVAPVVLAEIICGEDDGWFWGSISRLARRAGGQERGEVRDGG